MEPSIAEDAHVQALNILDLIELTWISKFEFRHLLNVETTDTCMEVYCLSLGCIYAGLTTRDSQVGTFEKRPIIEGCRHILDTVVADEGRRDYSFDPNS